MKFGFLPDRAIPLTWLSAALLVLLPFLVIGLVGAVAVSFLLVPVWPKRDDV